MSYIFNADTMISMPRKAENAVVSELLSNFTYGGKWEICFGGVENEITVGKAEKAERGGRAPDARRRSSRTCRSCRRS